MDQSGPIAYVGDGDNASCLGHKDLFGVPWAIGVIGVLTFLSGVVVKIVMSETLPRTRPSAAFVKK